ncbi:ATP-binding cassette domain-containing protein [Streptomyces sp. HNM0575]|uniref:ATP-binding cassette domain-containing protein n=1 Tax=Streptomyces sp. HNM0575 TaxID=2716338 RepID=UPI00145CE586|nr:ATP-binding cassette domain-containing protein [Streptomyces sp. HNM0575]NLU74857.1 ATP-binding cassette domain-containing protein [Streptomyces sp. HNM0575]
MIEAYGLTKRYGAKTAVYNLSFQVRPGTVTGFLGPNGSGKSTTMRMILGLDAPTAGQVTVGGHPFRNLPNAPRQVGALLDAKAVHGGRSARSHLLSLAQLSGIPARRVDEVLGVVGLQQVARKRSQGFSLGMGQRLGIAAALLGDPQVLLFDEPVNGLDPEGILWVRNLMKQLASEGRTVFVSSHLMSEMALTAEHLIVIGRGQLMADTSVKEFIAQNSVGFARVRTPEGDPAQREKLTSALREAGGQVQPEEDGALRISGLPLPHISDLAHKADVRLWELSPHQASLEEAYMRLTQGAVDFRSTADQRSGLQHQQQPQQLAPGQLGVPMPPGGPGAPGVPPGVPGMPGAMPPQGPPQGPPPQGPAQGPPVVPGAPGGGWGPPPGGAQVQQGPYGSAPDPYAHIAAQQPQGGPPPVPPTPGAPAAPTAPAAPSDASRPDSEDDAR